MLEYFRKNQQVFITFIIFYCLLSVYTAKYFQGNSIFSTIPFHLPLFGGWYNKLVGYEIIRWLIPILTAILILILGFLLVRISISYLILPQRAQFPALFYVTTSSFVLHQQMFSLALPASVFLLLAFARIVGTIDVNKLSVRFLDAGLLLALGELIGRPKQGEVSVKYFKNQAASDKKTAGGWVHTGDICHRDAEGWYYFDYRKGGGIRHNGDFVNPGFVEQVLAEHPGISDVFVYGVPAASGAPGECDVVAAVESTSAFDPADVFAWCRKHLEPNFVPAYLQVVEEIPKTASEKPQARFLQEQFAPDAGNVYVAN